MTLYRPMEPTDMLARSGPKNNTGIYNLNLILNDLTKFIYDFYHASYPGGGGVHGGGGEMLEGSALETYNGDPPACIHAVGTGLHATPAEVHILKTHRI